MLEQVEESGLGPVDVLDDECEGALSGAPLECFPNRPEDLFRRTSRECLGKLVLGAYLSEDLTRGQ